MIEEAIPNAACDRMLEMWRGRPACKRVPFISRRDDCPTGLSRKLKFLGALSVFSDFMADAFIVVSWFVLALVQFSARPHCL